MKKEKLITILGPTASGKTELGVYLAKKLGSSVISGDAFQVYKGMDIGTAKVTPEEAQGVTHYLVDALDATEPYSAAIFQEKAKSYITEENKKGKIPILVGGTGLYIQGLLEGYTFLPEVKKSGKWHSLYQEKGKAALFEQLSGKVAAEKIPQDPQRMIRQLGLIEEGYSLESGKSGELLYDGPVIGITMDRMVLYDRINTRVHNMIRQGLKKEVEAILEKGISEKAQALKGIGYKEMVSVIQGKMTIEEAEILISKNTRHFAKRQITWYKRMPYIHWIERQSNKDIWFREIEAYVNSWFRGE